MAQRTWHVISWAPEFPRETIRIDGKYSGEAVAREQVAWERSKGRIAYAASVTDGPVRLDDELFRQIESGDVRGGTPLRQTRKPTFRAWLLKQRKRRDPVGDLGRDAFHDHQLPKRLDTLANAEAYLRVCGACRGAHMAMCRAWREWSLLGAA